MMSRITLPILLLLFVFCGGSAPEDVYDDFVLANNARDAERLVGCLWFPAWDGLTPDEVESARRELIPTAEREFFLDEIVDHEVIQVEERSEDERLVLARQVFLDAYGNRFSDQYSFTLVRRDGAWFIYVPAE
ncbi:MAG: hypothetical protein A2Y64_01885 [Candidatus Coatesbacteria bacterium RBG_13_66_14]|uniref:DUF4878 domain-containing protein n=1 Tax=Candidatus Coatesbacteria bacterium RBG_13_66_14 TaxID=1817816 RepID=A0A1F5F489_9BACT|nr:MAG: hypothetical protein A2Y64_01885 [Candidatus Coatesbacteria bacterium RBG_13_66_14]